MQREIEQVCKLAGVQPEDIVLHDRGVISRAYVFRDGEVVFKFAKSSLADYENEARVLDFINTLKLGVGTPRVNWRDEFHNFIGLHGVVGQPLSAMLRKNISVNKYHVGKELGKFLRKLHKQALKTCYKLLDVEIEDMRAVWNNRDREYFDRHFSAEEQSLMHVLMTAYVPTELRKLGEKLVLSHSDLHEGNVIIGDKASVGVIDFDSAGHYDEARDFARMDDDVILNAMLDAYGADATLREKVRIRREIVRPFSMLAQGLFVDDYLPWARRTLAKYGKWKMLLLDTVTPQLRVELVVGDKSYAREHKMEKDSPPELKHDKMVCKLIRELLDEAGITLADLTHYAVNTGPGGFTGPRVGIAVIKAFHMVHPRPILADGKLTPVEQLEPVYDGEYVVKMKGGVQ